jgi:hypothetical protein
MTMDFKKKITWQFPAKYTVLPLKLRVRIRQLDPTEEEEREIINFIAQLTDPEADAFLQELEDLQRMEIEEDRRRSA